MECERWTWKGEIRIDRRVNDGARIGYVIRRQSGAVPGWFIHWLGGGMGFITEAEIGRRRRLAVIRAKKNARRISTHI
jgi:hypothetical protein